MIMHNSIRPLIRRRMAVLSLVLVVLLTVTKWNLVLASLESLVLSPWVFAVGSSNEIPQFRTDIIEYWIAAVTLIVLFVVLLKVAVRELIIGTRSNIPGTGESSAKSGRTGSTILLTGLVVSLLAPILVPFNPTLQGDLRETRLLKPLERGLVDERIQPLIDGTQPTGARPFGAQCLQNADNLLLGRRQSFSKLPESLGGSGYGTTPGPALFFLGTDDLGRDVFSRLLYAMRISMFLGIAAMTCAVTAGCAIGFTAGIAGGWVDSLLMRLTDLFLSIPALFLVIALVALLGNSTFLLILVLASTGWMGTARMVRGEVLKLREREFVLTARLLGRSSYQIVRDHMLPNTLPVIAAASVMQLGNVILAEAALSFLGLGIQPPTPSLGNMIGESFNHIDRAWWLGVFPGVALSATVISVNLLSEELQRKVRVAQ